MATKKLEAIISLNDQFSAKAKNVERSSSRMETGLKTLGKAGLVAAGFLGTAAVAGVTALGKASLSAAADFETMGVALKTSFQGNAEEAAKAQKQITDFASKTPFQLEEVMRSFIKLKNMGLDSSEAAMQSYGDTASAMGKSLNDMVEAVADATTGEFERLKEFGIRASSEGDRVKFTFQGVTTEVGKNSAEIEQYLISIGQTNFSGGMEAQSKTLTGLISTLKDKFSTAMATIEIESGLLDVAKEATGGLSQAIVEATPKIVEITKRFADWFKNKEYIDWFNGIKIWLEEHGIKIEDIHSAINMLVEMYNNYLKPALVAIWNTIKSQLAPELQNIKEQFTLLYEQIKPHIPLIIKLTGLFIVAVAVIGGTLLVALAAAVTGLIKLQLAFNGVFLKITNIIGIIGSAIGKINIFGTSIANFVRQAISSFISLSATVTGIISGIISRAYTWGAHMIENFSSGIKSKLGELKKSAQDVVGSIKGILGFSKNPLLPSEKWGAHMMDNFTNSIVGSMPQLKGAMGQVIAIIRAKFDETADLQRELQDRLQSITQQGEKSLIDTLVEARKKDLELRKEFEKARDDLNIELAKSDSERNQDEIDRLRERRNQLEAEMKEQQRILSEHAGDVIRFDKQIKERESFLRLDPIAQIKAQLSQDISSLLSDIKGKLNTGGFVNSFGKIKKFAAGGVVNGSGVRDTVPAMLSPGEVVINPRRGQGFGNTNNITININGANDPRAIAAEVKRSLARELELSDLGAL